MESNLDREQKKKSLLDEFPFLKEIKGRLVSFIDPETKKRYVGHVAIYYKDTGRIRIDWDNGATTKHDFSVDSKWVFSVKGIKGEG